MIRRLGLDWPDPNLAAERDSLPIRLLAVSDMPERALDFEVNRDAIGRIDAVVGCGDLEPEYLDFLANSFSVPLHYVRGNHDRGANWRAGQQTLPEPMHHHGEELAGLSLVGLSWPSSRHDRAVRDEMAAWRQVFRLGLRGRKDRRTLVISHVPPFGLGDTPDDLYHRGFAAYHWLCRRLNPVLWLHGHTSLAARNEWRTRWGETMLVNVTGAVLVEIGTSAQPGR